MKKTQQPNNLKSVIITGLVIFTPIIFIGWLWSNMFEINVKADSKLLQTIGIIKPTPTPLPKPTAENLSSQVVPKSGYQVNLNWGETGKKLLSSGAIDLSKYQEKYADARWQEYLSYLTDSKDTGITINSNNAYFWVNTLWALGLTQKSDVLDKGIMGSQYKDKLGNFASTGGWTLGAKDAVSLYSSSQIIALTNKQQELVNKISQNIYRPCCSNPTSFPDCNHGMAILGLIELMVSQNFSEDDIYKAALAFNSYWFPQTYVDLAYYFQIKENTAWSEVDAKRALSAEFSSSTGYQAIKRQIGNIPGQVTGGGSCGA
jgi:hypothetical protein